jgi:hypothetical protein
VDTLRHSRDPLGNRRMTGGFTLVSSALYQRLGQQGGQTTMPSVPLVSAINILPFQRTVG